MLIKQAVSLYRFHMCFHVFLRSFVPFHMLLYPLFRSNVLLWESPLLLRDVTGEALFSSAVAWLCVEIESAVTLLVLRCYGFYEVLDSGRPCASWRAMKGRSKEKSAKSSGASFLNCPILDSPTGGCSNQIIRVGRSPASHGFRGHAYII